jgi:Tol biopolymer transport system component
MRKSNYRRVIFGITFLLIVTISFSISGNTISTNEKIENQENTLKTSEFENNNTISNLEEQTPQDIIDNTIFSIPPESNQAIENYSIATLNIQYEQFLANDPVSDQLWSPDGTKLAYIVSPGGRAYNCELWVANKSSDSPLLINHQLIYVGAESTGLLDWRDDWILFKIRFEEGTPSAYYGRDELWKIRTDGSDLTQVTFTYTNGIRYLNMWRPNRGSVNWGMWIPGTSLIYFSAHNGNGWWRAFVCNDDGSDNWQHRSYPDYAFRISMSPTGNKLLWGHASSYYNPTILRACNVDGSGRTTIKSFSKRTSFMVLSDGNTVIWGNNDNIYAIDIDGSNQRTVIDDEHVNQWFNYDPVDGQKLIMGSDRTDSNIHLYSIRVDGTDIVQLTDGPYMDTLPQYSPNGNCLSYLRRPEGSTPPYPYELIIKSLLLQIAINSPTPNQIFGVEAPAFDITITGSNIDSTWYSFDDGVTKIFFNGLTGTIDQSEWDKIGHGTTKITFYANDTNGNIGQAEVTIVKDILAPIITIFSPLENQIISSLAPTFMISIVEDNLDTTWVSLDGGITKIFFSGLTGTIDQSEWDKIGNGMATISFFANDSAGNIGHAEVIVTKDDQIPVSYADVTDQLWSPDGTSLAYIKSSDDRTYNCELWVADKSPDSALLINHQLIYVGAEFNGLQDWRDDWILFKIRFEEGTPSAYYGRDELWKIRTDGSDLTQITFTYTNGIRYLNMWRPNRGSLNWGRFIPGTSLIYFSAHNGNGWWRAFVCNDDGSDNWQHRSYPDYAFRISMSPTGNKLLWGHASSYYHPTILRASNVDGSGRTTIKSFSKRTSFMVLSDGNTVIWGNNDNIYAIDIDGSNQRTIIDDEHVNQWFNYDPVYGQKLIIGSDRTDGNIHLYSIRVDGTDIVQLTYGPYMDSHPQYSPNGNCLSYLRRPEGSTPLYSYDLVVKCLLLQIEINSPFPNQIFGVDAPAFDITITGSNIDSTWYSLDDGVTNVFFNGLTGTIDQSEWDKIGHGITKITFYANDTYGNIRQEEVTVVKDILAPIITINSPIDDQVFGVVAPTFDLSIIEDNLFTTWYSFDGGFTNIFFNGLTGTIDQSEWDKIFHGIATIT